jgi:hypothetical protein
MSGRILRSFFAVIAGRLPPGLFTAYSSSVIAPYGPSTHTRVPGGSPASAALCPPSSRPAALDRRQG